MMRPTINGHTKGKTVMTQDTAKRLLTHLHRLTHFGKRKMTELLDKNEIDITSLRETH